jgi:hypothetical protein
VVLNCMMKKRVVLNMTIALVVKALTIQLCSLQQLLDPVQEQMLKKKTLKLQRMKLVEKLQKT